MISRPHRCVVVCFDVTRVFYHSHSIDEYYRVRRERNKITIANSDTVGRGTVQVQSTASL